MSTATKSLKTMSAEKCNENGVFYEEVKDDPTIPEECKEAIKDGMEDVINEMNKFSKVAEDLKECIGGIDGVFCEESHSDYVTLCIKYKEPSNNIVFANKAKLMIPNFSQDLYGCEQLYMDKFNLQNKENVRSYMRKLTDCKNRFNAVVKSFKNTEVFYYRTKNCGYYSMIIRCRYEDSDMIIQRSVKIHLSKE